MKTHVRVLTPYMRTDFGTCAHTHYVCLSGQLSRSADMFFSLQFQMNKDLFYAHCCLREHTGYSLLSVVTSHNGHRE